MSGSASLRLAGVRKSFGEHIVVDDFDLDIHGGEFVSFLGPSGCGKTTTLRMVAGFERPTSGSILLDGTDITDQPPNRRGVGMVFQNYALFPNMTVRDNIGFGLKVRRTAGTTVRSRVEDLLGLIHLRDAGGKYPHELSGGMQQRVALARALAIEPRVLLLDEPLSALDAKIRTALRAEIRTIQRQLGITTIYVTHDQEEALAMSDRVVVMDRGRVEQVGRPADIYNAPATEFVARFVGTLNVLHARVEDPVAGTVLVGGSVVRSAHLSTGLRRGEGLALALRPESLTIEALSNGDRPPGIAGRVEDVSFLGSIVRVRVVVEEDAGSVLVDHFNDPGWGLPSPGDRVSLSFPDDAALRLDRRDDRAGASASDASRSGS
jgi:putative spermidine/putrescine transport system ATP-binding protein